LTQNRGCATCYQVFCKEHYNEHRAHGSCPRRSLVSTNAASPSAAHSATEMQALQLERLCDQSAARRADDRCLDRDRCTNACTIS
jgi:hypothetical protein